MYKRYMEVYASLDTCISFFCNNDKIMAVNPNLKVNKTVKSIGSNARIMRREIGLSWPMSNRDFSVYWELIYLNDGSAAIVTYSVSTSLVPTNSSCERAKQECYLMHFRPISSSR